MEIAVAPVRLEVGDVAPSGITHLEGTVFVPPVETITTVLCCFPGGGMSRHYFDLAAPGYSMARYLAGLGHLVVAIDHPAVGDSDRPDDGYTLTPRTVAAVDARAVEDLKHRLMSGAVTEELEPVDQFRCVGVGHSMGAKAVIYQQAHHRPFDAVCLLGIGGRGLCIPRPAPDTGWLSTAESGMLSPEVLAFSDRPGDLQARLPELAREHYRGNPLPQGTTATSDLLLAGMPVEPAALDAIRASSTSLLALCGLSSMVPGSSAPEMAAIDTPVFIGAGSRDITGPPHDIPASFTGSNDVTLFVLGDAGHNHNVAPNRVELWNRIHDWLSQPGLRSR